MLEGHDLANLLFCAHTLWLNYITVTFLLVSSSLGTNYDRLCLCRVMAKKAPDQKHRTKNFAKLPNHLPLFTMLYPFPCIIFTDCCSLSPLYRFTTSTMDR